MKHSQELYQSDLQAVEIRLGHLVDEISKKKIILWYID